MKGMGMEGTKIDRKAAREDVAAVVEEVYADWIAGNGTQEVTCSFDINTGPCCDFAEDVARVVLERFPGTDIEVEDYEDHLRLDGLTAQGVHYYVKADSWYFDASMREGVHSPDVLPTCHSIRICASRMDEDDVGVSQPVDVK